MGWHNINEVYFGKQPQLQKIEKELDEFRNKYMTQYLNANSNSNSDPILYNINREFEKFFNFGNFCIFIMADAMPNTFTIPIDYNMEIGLDKEQPSKNICADYTTFKYKKWSDYACIVCVNTGLIFNPKFTTNEVMAAIMHEIGHNFFTAINDKNIPLAAIYRILYFVIVVENIIAGRIDMILQLFIASNTFIGASIKSMADSICKNGLLIKSINTINAIFGFINAIFGTTLTIVNLLTFNLFKSTLMIKSLPQKIASPVTYIQLPINYRNERTADNFVAMYGYGTDLAAFTRKMEESGNTPNKLEEIVRTAPFIGTLYNLIGLGPMILLTAFDAHPHGIVRAKDQLALLYREIEKSDLDRKMKARINSDIAGLEREINRMQNKQSTIKDPDFFRHVYNRILYEFFAGKTVKDLLLDDRAKFEKYDETFYKNLDKS